MCSSDLGAAHAFEYQGHLPRPTQKLPAYPPIVCIAPNWAIEPCEDRQTPLPRANPLRAFAKHAPAKTKTVLYDERGGMINEHIERWRKVDESGDDVEIRGKCPSACTLIMGFVPSDRICFGEDASLQFHMPGWANDVNQAPGIDAAKWMLNQYPQDIRAWIIAKGGVEKMTYYAMWKLDAQELWRMGCRKCEPEPEPVSITQSLSEEIWKERDRKAEEAWKEWQKSRFGSELEEVPIKIWVVK